MPPPDGCAPSRLEWERFLRLVDARLATRIESYTRESGPFSDQEFAIAHGQFAGLGRRGAAGGGDPDYSTAAVPVVYALRFLPQRMATIVSALDLLSKKRELRGRARILDVGSGIDSVSFALEATGITSEAHRVLCVDPSRIMQGFANGLECGTRRRHITTDIEAFLSIETDSEFDAVFLSYAFDYEHERKPDFLRRVAERLAGRLAKGGFILYAGPEGKDNLADELASHFQSSLGKQTDDLSSDWAPHLRRPYSMPRLQSLYAESVAAAKRGGLSPELLDDLLNPNTGAPSWIFTYTKPSQIVFAASRP